MRTRYVGAAMVMASVAALVALRLLVTMQPGNHPATTAELLLAAFIVLAGLPGIGMLVEGSAMFDLVDRPRER